ncbi:MAG TPA: Crp/Fnr family transcriptional regulator [Candidatus Acidoferrum sp.]|nr:Crp/Fnr family transcriptional regulator [Candidatus Acidoferrum sp.]
MTSSLALGISVTSKVLESGKTTRHGAETTICTQGERCNEVYYIQHGIVKLTAVSKRGRSGVLGILVEGDFFGEECITGQETHSTSAVALVPTTTIAIRRDVMLRLLQQEKALSSQFLNHLLARNQRMQQDLVDHMFNSSEKRLARVLLLLANYQNSKKGPAILESISQDNLAEMVGTTRQRVNFFMNKFRRMGFIQYNGSIKVHSSLRKILEE